MEHPGEPVTIDLERNELRYGNHVVSFRIEPFARECLLNGVDTLGWLLKQTSQIEQYERDHAA